MLPEIISAVQEKENIENSPFLSDKASGIYNCAYGIGNCLAPIIGGAITGSYPNSKIGFRSTCDIMALSSLSFGVLYVCFAIIPAHFDDKKKKARRADKLAADLMPTSAIDNSLTIEFENNRSQIGQGALNDSQQQNSLRKSQGY